MTQTTGFERVWNRTLGAPQQFLLRSWRAVLRDDIDLFSHRGILDWSLIPGLGLFDKGEPTEDIGFEEAFDLTLGRIGVPKTWATEFAANVVTDPLNLLTGGATALARGARGAGKALRITEVKAALGKGSKVADLKRAVGEVLDGKHGTVTGKRRSLLKRAERALVKEVPDDTMEIEALLSNGAKQELRFGLPNLIGRGAFQWRTDRYKSWVKFARDKSPGAQFAAAALKPVWVASKPLQPVFEEIGKKWNAISEGARTAHLGLGSRRFAQVAPIARRNLDNLNRRIYENVTDTGEAAATFAEEYGKHGDFGRAAAKALGVSSKKVDDYWTALTGGKAPKITPDDAPLSWFQGHLDDFRAGYDETLEEFRAAKPEDVLSVAGEAQRRAIADGNIKLFNFTRGFRRGWRKLWVTDTKVEGAIEAERTWRTVNARAQDQMEETLGALGNIFSQIETKGGFAPGTLGKLMVGFAEGTSPVEELAHFRQLSEMNPGNPLIGKSLEAFALRQIGAVEGLLAYARQFHADPQMTKVADALERLAGNGVTGRDIQAVFDDLVAHKVRVEPAVDDVVKHLPSRRILLTGDGRGTHLAFLPTRALTAQSKAIEKALANPRRKVALDEARRADLENLRQVIAARRGKVVKFIPRPRATVKTVKAPGRNLVSAGTVGDHSLVAVGMDPGTTEFIESVASLGAVAKEIQRAARAYPGQPLPAPLVARGIDEGIKSSRLVEEAMFGALGKEGQDALNMIRYLRAQVHATSAALGNIVPGSPLGYLGHILSREQVESLRTLYGEDGIGTLMDTGAPRLGAAMRRHLDALTLPELNTLYRTMIEKGGEQGARVVGVLDDIAKQLGFEQGFRQFEENPILALTTRLSQNQRALNAADFFNNLQNASEQFRGAQVVRVVRAGEKVELGKTRKLEKVSEKGRTTELKVAEEAIEADEIEGLVVRLEKGGEEVFVPKSALGAGTAILDLGKPNLKTLYQVDEFELIGPDVASAFALRTMRGTINERDFVRGSADTMDAIAARLLETGEGGRGGSYVVIGDEEAITSAVSAIQAQWAAPSATIALMDKVDYFLRRASTIWRPAFIIGNQASYIAQTGVLVKNPRSILGGYADAVRFMLDPKERAINKLYDPLAATLADAGRYKIGFDPVSVARRGGGKSELDLIYRLGDGTEMRRSEIFQALEDVLVSHTREGLRGTARTSRTAGEALKQGARRQKGLGKAHETAIKFFEGSEGLPRLATVFAQVREGVPLKEAVENALMVHVNYADITQFERAGVKRILGFYTFMRKFAPVAFEELAKNPAHASVLAQISKENGFVREESGKPRLVAGPVTLDLSRLNPVMESLHLTRFAAQAFGEMFGPEEGTAQDALTGRQRAPFSLGPTPEAVVQGLQATRRGGFGEGAAAGAEEYLSWFWGARVAMDYFDDNEETSAVDTFWSQIAPATRNDPERRRTLIRSRYRAALNDIKKKYEQARSPADRRAYAAEATRLEATAIRTLENIK